MTMDSPKTLRILFAIPQTKLNADLTKAAAADPRAISHRVHAHYAHPGRLVTPRHAALGYHLEMLLASALWHNPNAPKEISLFYADWAAQQIAFEAFEIGCAKGRLGELCGQMENIKRREGLAEDEFWCTNEGPADYETAQVEWEAINDRIQQTVMLFR